MTPSTLSASSHSPVPSNTTKSQQPIKLLLVDFRNGESVCAHPEVAPMLNDGWTIRSAVPRIVEDEGTRLLVVLTRHQKTTTRPLTLAARTTDGRPPTPLTEGPRPT